MNAVVDAKRALRAEVRRRRRERDEVERERLAQGLTTQLQGLCEAHDPAVISCYVSRPEEPRTDAFLDWARTAGIEVLLPVSHPDGALGWAIDDGTRTLDTLGMPAPATPELGEGALARAELLIIPAALIARDGSRLGWGLGYFDRSLARLPTRPQVYAVVFDDEFVDTLPREEHDIPVTGVVTPSGTTAFSPAPK